MILVLDENTNRMSGTAVDPSTLGECTGLTDKNGKLIFEGDIIAYEDETPGQYEYHDSLFINRGIIKFGDGQFYFTNSIAATMDDLLNSGILDCEVIGNIHDNPELLKGADKPVSALILSTRSYASALMRITGLSCFLGALRAGELKINFSMWFTSFHR